MSNKGKSPYQRSKKTAFRYSEFYRRWRSSPTRHNAEAHTAHCERIHGKYWSIKKEGTRGNHRTQRGQRVRRT